MKHLLMILGAAALLPMASGAARAQRVVVVVNTANPVSTLSKAQVSNVFLKKVTKWSEGKSIVPVDQDRNSKVREVFSKAVHNRSVSSITTYWQTQIFSGKDVPPVTKPTDADVLAMVRANPGAVGYVSSATPLGTGVKALVVAGL